ATPGLPASCQFRREGRLRPHSQWADLSLGPGRRSRRRQKSSESRVRRPWTLPPLLLFYRHHVLPAEASFMIALTVLALAFSAGPLPPPDDSHELIILHATRPYRVRLHLRIHGRPFSEPWARQVGQLFRHLDTNKDGKLSAKELALAPSREQWL